MYPPVNEKKGRRQKLRSLLPGNARNEGDVPNDVREKGGCRVKAGKGNHLARGRLRVMRINPASKRLFK